MVGSGKVIAQRFAAVFSDKDGSGIADLHHYFKRVGRHDLQMLRCDLVCSLNRLVHRLCNQCVAIIVQRFADDFAS